jgi:hypothetical protein
MRVCRIPCGRVFLARHVVVTRLQNGIWRSPNDCEPVRRKNFAERMQPRGENPRPIGRMAAGHGNQKLPCVRRYTGYHPFIETSFLF